MRIFCLLLLQLQLLLVSPPSLAHSKLGEVQPANGSTLTTLPAVIVLDFRKPIEDKFHAAELQQGEQWLPLASEVVGGKSLHIPLTQLKAGQAVNIRWRVMSRDGHRQNGRLRYQYQP